MDLKFGWEGVDCINLAQDRVQWWTLVSMVINFLNFINEGSFVD
jgi:hypothetical protein